MPGQHTPVLAVVQRSLLLVLRRPDVRLGTAAAIAVAAVDGVLTGWLTPRGPITTAQAIAAIAASLVVGLTAGLLSRSRWAILFSPVAFAAVFELTRLGTSGPLEDGIHLGSAYGVLAFVLGRGVHATLALLPMMLGAALGAALARHLDGDRSERRGRGRAALGGRRVVTALVCVGLIALAAGLARPARTAPVLAADGASLAGSIAELRRIDVNGTSLAMMIRGRDLTNPVILYLAGGPGGSDIGALSRNGGTFESRFTVATYDQRGAGKSYDALDPTSTLTLAGAVSDVVAVTNYLRERFHQDTIYLVGNSWGSLLGVLAAQQHPELYAAFVGSGQMVDLRATDRVYYQDTLAWARRTGNTGLVEQLTRNGPPPYADALDYGTLLLNEHQVYPYDDTGLAEGWGGMSENLFLGEYTLFEQVHLLAGVLNVFPVLYPQLQDLDLRTQVTRLEIPVYLVQGGHETRARAEPVGEWFALLQAPAKHLIVFEASGHRALFQEPGRFARVLTDTVLTDPVVRARQGRRPL